MQNTPVAAEMADLVHAVQAMGDLLKHQIDVAKREVTEQAKQQAKAGAAFGVAGALAYAGVLMALIFMMALWMLVVPFWAAALIMTVVMFAAAGAIAAYGVHKQRTISLHRTQRMVKEDLAGIAAAHPAPL